MITTRVLTGFLASFLVLISLPAQGEEVIKFGIYTSDKPTDVVRQFRPVLNVLENCLVSQKGQNIKIKMKVASSYEQGVEDLVKGRVDFSRLGPASYILAKKANPGISIIAVEAKKGKKVFNGVICVRKDSSIQDVTDLKGKRFAFGNERSTIGRYLSQLYLSRHGIKANDLAGYDYLGRHDKVGTAVGLGSFDAGALKESTYKKLVARGEPLRAIAVFPNVTKPWVARQGLSDEIKNVIRICLVGMTDAKALKALKKVGFVVGQDSDYAVIREAIRDNHLFFESVK